MSKSYSFPLLEMKEFFQHLDQFANRESNLGLFSENLHKIDNEQDYLNFAWKYDSSCLAGFQDKFTWLDNVSDLFAQDLDDQISSHYEPTLIGLSTLDSKLHDYLYGSLDSDEGSHSSWNLPDSHPLKVLLTLPGNEDFAFNTNWYERLQSSYRNLWLMDRTDILSEFNNDHEYSLLSEVGLFANASKNLATSLLFSLLSSNLTRPPLGFFEVTPELFPLIHKFYSPKFKNDRIFVSDGIVFTFVVGNIGSYSKTSFNTCKKLYSNDFKGRQALCDAIHNLATSSTFALPFYCVTDYMGFRVVAEPLMPLSDDTKFFLEHLRQPNSANQNPNDVTSSLLSNSELSSYLIKMSSFLRLSSWPLPLGSSDYDESHGFNSTIDVVELNGLLNFRNAVEVLPPYLDFTDDQSFNHRFRQEFSAFHYERPLKCSMNSQPFLNKGFDNSAFKDAAEYNGFLLENNIDKFHTVAGSWDISNSMHSHGLNLRKLGYVYERTSHTALKDMLAAEMVARAFKHLWEREIENFLTFRNFNITIMQEAFLMMLNDLLGLTLDSVSFWEERLLPQISMHFNVVDLQGISYKALPQLLLITAIEFNLGVAIPILENGQRYTTPIKFDDFTSKNCPSLLRSGSTLVSLNFYPKVSVTCPRSNMSIFRAASKLCDHKDPYGYSFLLNSSSFGMGLPSHMKSKLLGTGYPCDPICVYNTKMLCSRFNNHMTGLNLYCLSESLLQTDPIKRFKLLLTLGYAFLSHRFYTKALKIANFLAENLAEVTLPYIEAKILELQCHCLMGNSETIDSEYRVLSKTLKNLEGFDGFLNLQLLILVCYDAWNKRDLSLCSQYINDSKDSFLHLFSVKNYEWVPVFFFSLLGYCSRDLNVHFDSTKVHHELVRHCNLSNLPTYTKCNLFWLLLESLIRVGSYSTASKICTDLMTILEAEFGPLSMEYLRSLYVSAWINRQIGSIHFVHPYLYLSSSENLILYKGQQEWFENQDLIMEELSAANNSHDKRRHLQESLALYTTLLSKFLLLARQNKIKTLDVINRVDANFCTSRVEKLVNITREDLLRHGTETVRENLDDAFLKIYLDQSQEFQTKMILVVEQYLTLKILALDTKQCHAVANKLYNAYASQVSSDYTRRLSIGPKNEFPPNLVKQTYASGTRLTRPTESFSSHITIKKNIIPRSGHDLRSVEQLLMGEPEYNKQTICEMCLESCSSSDDLCNWFDSVFDFVHPKCVLSGEKFRLSLDILRNFSTPCQRLFILGHLASISNTDLNQTLAFKSFKKTMVNCRVRDR